MAVDGVLGHVPRPLKRAVDGRHVPVGRGGPAVLVINGVDATTCDFLIPPTRERELSRPELEARTDARATAALCALHRRRTEDHPAPRYGTDDTDASYAGWGFVLAADAEAESQVDVELGWIQSR